MHINEAEPARNSCKYLGGVYRMQRDVRHPQTRRNRPKTSPMTTGSRSCRADIFRDIICNARNTCAKVRNKVECRYTRYNRR